MDKHKHTHTHTGSFHVHTRNRIGVDVEPIRHGRWSSHQKVQAHIIYIYPLEIDRRGDGDSSSADGVGGSVRPTEWLF